uniref:MAD2L1 binding protein n=1 Tax=Neogobius melanostomus TaxID=47308 RepID=A0A8C6SER9_9GOBI
MEENTSVLTQINHENTEVSPGEDSQGDEPQKRQPALSENDSNKCPPSSRKAVVLQSEEHKLDQRSDNTNVATKEQQGNNEALDPHEIQKRAQEEGCVNVVFPGTVTQDGCCRFVSEILKCVLYQRQQLPMTYDQLVYSQKKRPVHSADTDRRKCQQSLQELEEVLQQLEVLFSLSRVPRVLLLMGGSLVFPKELYEINMEALVLASGDKSLRVSSCLRQLFRTLFVADLLSDTKPVRLMPTTVLVLAHRDCGVGWFRPKLQFKVPTRVRSKVVALCSDLCTCEDLKRDEWDWDDYIWFQAPMTIKGFSNYKA